ncbi:MAG TPA: fatty acid desaturase family protein [Steroidobacteraceae bacterium]|nr:fatty acid desaturase family protein [Steroidobacteraceae bacterium]
MTRQATHLRDYSLLGPEGRAAAESGLVSAVWYSPPISRKRLGELMKKRNGPALRDTAIWIALLILSGSAGVWLWGSWLAIIPFTLYGLLYGSAGDSRWHECGHGTAFKTRWMNDAVYQIACFMMLREPRVWRASHGRHHADTIIVGRDPEINSMRPPDFLALALNLFALKGGLTALGHIMLHATGRLTAAEETFIAERWWPQVYRIARIWAAIFAGVITACVALHSILPAMLVGLPTFYGGPLTLIFGLTQHAGLAEDVLDHRLNSRTVYMNPISRFIYWNMNYHLEHHLFPMVPYHALPQLHALLKPHCPPAYPSLAAAYREIIPTLWRQSRDPRYCVVRPPPPHREI